RLRSGAEVPADVIVTATGLNLLPLGGIELTVDDEPIRVSEHVAYKGMMLDGVPNLAFALGYTNASWTLKVDLVSAYVARILAFMRRRSYASVTPTLPAEPMTTTPFIEMSSGYFERSRDALPLQGDRAPWRLQQHFFKDAGMFEAPVDSDDLAFEQSCS
ncbi:MAG: FAD-containing monooxygenase EthA, partial [Actinomycetota bacterium]|nr:FAD-containing monooxygenase EthA [Actinomycetota bacterium]